MDLTLKLNKYNHNIVAVNINTYDGFPHFVHVMEYFYYAIDKMLQYPDHLIILFEPKQFYKSYYVENFIKSIHELVDNLFMLIKILILVHTKLIMDMFTNTIKILLMIILFISNVISYICTNI